MAMLCRDLFTPISGDTERLVDHDGESVTWVNINDANVAGISPADLFIEPGGTVYHSGYSSATGSMSTSPAFQVSRETFPGSDIVAQWSVVDMGEYKAVEVGPGSGDGVHAYERGTSDDIDEMFTAASEVASRPPWAGMHTDGTSDNGVTTTSAQLWFAMDDELYTGFYIDVSRGSIKLAKSDGATAPTYLGTYAYTFPVGIAVVISVVRHGSSISVYKDGTQIITASSSSYSGTGKRFGIRIDGGASQSRGIHVDSIYCYEESAAPASVGTPVLSGSCSEPEIAHLSWTAAANASSYELYRINSSGGTKLLHTGSELTYEDTGRSIGFWKYRVRGIGSAGNTGAFSNDCTVYVDTGYFIGSEPDINGDTEEKRNVYIRGKVPVDYWDGSAGRFCPVSGMWFPGSELVNVDGVVVGSDYAHLPQRPKPELPDIF